MGIVPLAWLWTLTYQYPSTPNPTSSLSRNAGPSVSSTNSLMPPRPHLPPIWNGISTCSKISPIPWYQHSIASLGPSPPLLLPVSPLAAPANTLFSLLLQLMKAIVFAERSCYFFIFHRTLSVPAMSTRRFRSLPYILKYSLSFYLSRFSFYSR